MEKDKIVWHGSIPFRSGAFRIVRMDPETCYVEVDEGDFWSSDVSDGVCAEVYMTAFLGSLGRPAE